MGGDLTVCRFKRGLGEKKGDGELRRVDTPMYNIHWWQILNKYNITINGTVPVSESFFIPEYRNVIRSGNNGSIIAFS